MERSAVGLDLGGTNLKGGIVTERGALLECRTVSSQVREGPDRVLQNLFRLTEELLERALRKKIKVTAIGVATPGVVDPIFGGIAGGADNLQGWARIPFMKMMTEQYKLPVCAHNDATATVLAEQRFGAGSGKKNVVMASFGTGIGGGIIIDGNLYSGSIGYAGEIGHIAVHAGGRTCACGIRGCWEEYASSRGIVHLAEEILREPESGKSPLYRIAAENGGKLTPELIFECAREKDETALKIVDEIGKITAVGIGGLINIFNPEVFIIGGGIASAGDIYLDAIMKHLPSWTLIFSRNAARVVLARLGAEAGIIGAAVLTFEGINQYKG